MVSRRSSSNVHNTSSKRRNGIPEFVFVPVFHTQDQEQADDCRSIASVDSLSSLETSRFVDHHERVPPRRPTRRHERSRTSDRTKRTTFDLRTQSLPTTLASTARIMKISPSSPACSSSKITATEPLTFSTGFFHDSNLSSDTVDEDHMDRAPRVPRRRRSIQTATSCPVFGQPIHHKAMVHGALAA